MFAISALAQNADARISDLINRSNWFKLKAEYPALKIVSNILDFLPLPAERVKQ